MGATHQARARTGPHNVAVTARPRVRLEQLFLPFDNTHSRFCNYSEYRVRKLLLLLGD